MSAELLRRAATTLRERAEKATPGPRAQREALAEWLDHEVPRAEYRERQQRDMEAIRVRPEPFPVYYDGSTMKAITLARLIVGEQS